MKDQQEQSRNYHEGFFGALIGSGVAYSISHGYGILHAIGMAVAFFIVGAVLLAAYYGARRLRGGLHV